MTQPHLLEQAKQGDPQAIESLMNKSLQPKGMTAHVERQGDHLEVLLEADRVPNRQALTAFVEKGIQNLGIETIASVTVSGQQTGAATAWSQKLYLDPLIPGFEPEAPSPTETTSHFDGSDFDSTDCDRSSFDQPHFDQSNFDGAPLEPNATASFGTDEASDLAQLQDLLSDQSEHSLSSPQRQELESRLESLWAEQSEDQHQDFLSELMAEDPQDATRQFEAFLAEQPDDRFQSIEQEGLWTESPEQEADNLLAELNFEDAKQSLTQQFQEPSYGWQETDEESGDEPDEVLYNFMEGQPPLPDHSGLDENGEPIDEADEILPGFLEGSGEFSFDTSPDSIDELSLGVEEEPGFSQIDFAAGEHPEALTDATSQSWEYPPIEFLQSDLEPPPLELPTEQFEVPSADFTMESSFDVPNRSADFPPDFLQESPADQSHDLFVEPQTNPFIEQMEDQDRERSPKPEDESSQELNQFDQSEWLLEDGNPSSQSQGLSQSQYSEGAESSDDLLSDDALINFFEEDTDPNLPYPNQPPVSSESGIRPDNPDAPVFASDSSRFDLDTPVSPYGDLSDRADQADAEEDLDLFLEPDQPESSGYYANTEIPDSPLLASTEIPAPGYGEGEVADTQIPVHQEPSPEDLEQQVAEIYPEDTYVASNASSEVVETTSDSRGSPWLFPLILLGISGWIVGLISFAFLWSRLSSPPPETAGVSSDVVDSPNAVPTACPSTTAAIGNAPIALSELQFQPNTSNPQQINLIGCLTNRTQQPVDIVSIGYRSGTASTPVVGGLNLANSVIQPGQTVPFTSKFTLPSETTGVSINTVYWQPAGQTTSQEANTSINLNR
jgi:hypothetical protein